MMRLQDFRRKKVAKDRRNQPKVKRLANLVTVQKDGGNIDCQWREMRCHIPLLGPGNLATEWNLAGRYSSHFEEFKRAILKIKVGTVGEIPA